MKTRHLALAITLTTVALVARAARRLVMSKHFLFDPVSFGSDPEIHLFPHQCGVHPPDDSDTEVLCGDGEDRLLIPRLSRGMYLVEIWDSQTVDGKIALCQTCLEVASMRLSMETTDFLADLAAAEREAPSE